MPSKPKTDLVILGIDPGIADTGFGIIRKTGSKLKALDYGSIKTKPSLAHEKRLLQIQKELTELIGRYRPQFAGVERLFFARNVTTAFSVAQARGVALLCIGSACLELKEYTPLQVKMALTGFGKADKKQIQQMVKTILSLKEIPKPDDAADALAIAI